LLAAIKDEPGIANGYLAAIVVPDEPVDRQAAEGSGVEFSLFPRTPYSYDFSKLTSDILGAVYEKYLAHRVLEDGRRVVVDLDQTVRQQEGAYFTHPKVAEYLVRSSLGPMVEPIVARAVELLDRGQYDAAFDVISNELGKVRVLDPACGSGVFLMQAFRVLSEGFAQYNSHVAQVRTRRDIGLFDGPRTFEGIAQQIVSQQLFGVDKDVQAVEVARLNLWLMLLRSDKAQYKRNAAAPNRRLPSLDRNVVVRDSVAPHWNLKELCGDGRLAIVSNPPWGAEVGAPDVLAGYGYTLAVGQYDSWEVFLEAAIRTMVPEDKVAYLVPDSLFLPEHERTRKYLVDSTSLERITRLGEGLFKGVYRGATALISRKGPPVDDQHTVRCAIVTKAGRDRLRKAEAASLSEIESEVAHEARQARFKKNPGTEFDINISTADEPVIERISDRRIDWQDHTTTFRGVELGKGGHVLKCPYCGTWTTLPKRDKQGNYGPKRCTNFHCRQEFQITDAGVQRESIIRPIPDGPHYKRLIVGEAVHRYSILEHSWIDTSKCSVLPVCPHCGTWDHRHVWAARAWACASCGRTFTEAEVRKTHILGIDYKALDSYAGPKLLVRKTGRGIYATVDKTDALTMQVVFVFKLREDPIPDLSLFYLLGVLNSRLMLYYYYKKTAEVEWRSFPYMTQKVIMSLPVRKPDLKNNAELLLHNQIAETAEWLVDNPHNPDFDRMDRQCEQLVRNLYGLTPQQNARIGAELDRIGELGTLLAQPEEDEREEP
jgi:type I restriction-modification system DNA methylase subunit